MKRHWILQLILPLIMLLVMGMFSPVMAQDTGGGLASEAECQYDLTGQTLKFYHFGDLSGVYTFITLPVLAGFEDAVAYFNENGGVCGATIQIDYFDTAGTSEGAQAAWDEFTSREDTHVVFLYLTEDSELLRNQAESQQIPIVVSAGSVRSLYGDNADDPAWVFGAVPLYQDQLGAFCQYISQHWSEYGIEGDPVIGHVSWLGAFGEASDTEESRAYCQSLGVGYAKAMYYFPGIPDISTQIQRVIEEGANIIYTTSLTSGPAQLATTVEALGLRDQVLLAGPAWVLDSSVVNLGGESVAGIIGQLPFLWWDELDQPGIQLVTANWAQRRLATAENPQDAQALRNIAYLLAWTTVDFYRQFMTVTINRVGPDNLSGQAVYDSLTSDITYNPLGGVLEINFSGNNRSAHRTRIATIQFNETEGGVISQVVPLTDWFETPDLKPGGADVP
jgi:ABC-type branched-subunit amino acid transport system substrate-binding protein